MLNSDENRKAVIDEFPKLKEDIDFRIDDKDDPNYNCIACAGNRTNVWWWPNDKIVQPFTRFDGVVIDWPFGAAKDTKLETMIGIFSKQGYSSCPDGIYEQGFQKICFYGFDIDEITHASRQIPVGKDIGKWTSKLGSWFRIIHGTPDTIENEVYGNVLHFMKRKWP